MWVGAAVLPFVLVGAAVRELIYAPGGLGSCALVVERAALILME